MEATKMCSKAKMNWAFFSFKIPVKEERAMKSQNQGWGGESDLPLCLHRTLNFFFLISEEKRNHADISGRLFIQMFSSF
jgi:hypothetical protein